jgi:hypothetical protein
LQLGPHVIAIPGIGNQDPLTAHAAAEALRLTPEEMTPLDNFHRRGT